VTVVAGPSAHLAWAELACHDGTEYPLEWRVDRAVMLAATFEHVRELLGNQAIVILSGYRTPAYNASLEGAAVKSQHVEGRALDIWHPLIEPLAVFKTLRQASQKGVLPLLGGLGIYRTFVHLDVRPKVPKGHLALWSGKGARLPA
jgi:hypothetical protein